MELFKQKKKIVYANIIENIKIAEDIYQMNLEAPEVTTCARAGQFVNVYLNNNAMLLPRPISICQLKDDIITLVYGVVGQGTRELSTYRADDKIKISTANGNGFDLEAMANHFAENIVGSKVPTVVLAAGGIGVPPMVELAKAIRKYQTNKIKLVAVIGFREESFLEKELAAICDEIHVATDKGTVGFHGNIVDLLTAQKIIGDYYFSCGPKVMLKALTAHCMNQKMEGSPKGTPIQVSMEERMGCGYGACVGCTCKIKGHDSVTNENHLVQKKVCKDGPVFLGSEVAFDE